MSVAPHGNTGLARRLVALEAPRVESPDPGGGGVGRVCNKLREPLSKLAGQAGFHSLLARALALAKAADPSLAPVQVRIDGTLGGYDGVRDPHGGTEPGTAVVAQLLGLLEIFIGVALTMRLVCEVWPELSGVEGNGGDS